MLALTSRLFVAPTGLVDACPTKRVRGLISTAVIRGSKDIYSSSVPDLVQLLNAVDSEEQQQASRK